MLPGPGLPPGVLPHFMAGPYGPPPHQGPPMPFPHMPPGPPHVLTQPPPQRPDMELKKSSSSERWAAVVCGFRLHAFDLECSHRHSMLSM